MVFYFLENDIYSVFLLKKILNLSICKYVPFQKFNYTRGDFTVKSILNVLAL